MKSVFMESFINFLIYVVGLCIFGIYYVLCVFEEDVFINFVWYEKMYLIYLLNVFIIKYFFYNFFSKIYWVDSF